MRGQGTRVQRKGKKQKALTAGATMIVQAAMRPDVSVMELAELAEQDAGFAMRLLSVVNSPAYGRTQPLSSIRQAASLLGIRGLRNLALSLVVNDMVPIDERASVLLANSVRRAVAGRLIAAAVGEREPDFYFTTGLLLEAGTLIHAREDVEEAIRIANVPAAQRRLIERAVGAGDHCHTGSEFVKSFSLPDEMVAAIASHHDATMPEERKSAVCWVAEKFAAVFEGGVIEDLTKAAKEAGDAIGIPRADLDRILEEIPGAVQTTGDSFQRKLKEQPPLEALAEDATRALLELNGQYQEVIHTLERVLTEKDTIATHLKQVNEDLARLAVTDALTGLPNKRGLEAALQRDLAQADRAGVPVSLLVLDIDHFKSFNDTWGHAVGDDVLAAVGKLLRDQVRAGDLAARFGGEEFVVVLPRTEPDNAQLVADRIRGALEAMDIEGPKGVLKVTTSVGIATAVGAGITNASQSLFERADAALYEAKNAGRNCVRAAA